MPAIASTIRRAAAKATLSFDWLIGAGNFFTLKKAAGMTDLSESFIEKLFDNGQLSGHEYNAGRGERMTKRIQRTFLIAFLVKTAKYDADTKRDALISCLREFTGPELHQIAEAALKLASERSGR